MLSRFCPYLTNYSKVFGTFFAAQLAVKQIQKQGTKGSIVLVASITAHVGLPNFRMASYNASKGGVLMLSKALASELAPQGIRVNTISPAFIDTYQTRVVRDAAPEKASVMWSQPPLGRIGEADELTGAIIYLLSDASTYTTGADIICSGGIHVGRLTDYNHLPK
jgi:sorbose reductase